jgi:hypothetical protein
VRQDPGSFAISITRRSVPVPLGDAGPRVRPPPPVLVRTVERPPKPLLAGVPAPFLQIVTAVPGVSVPVAQAIVGAPRSSISSTTRPLPSRTTSVRMTPRPDSRKLVLPAGGFGPEPPMVKMVAVSSITPGRHLGRIAKQLLRRDTAAACASRWQAGRTHHKHTCGPPRRRILRLSAPTSSGQPRQDGHAVRPALVSDRQAPASSQRRRAGHCPRKQRRAGCWSAARPARCRGSPGRGPPGRLTPAPA